MSMLAKVFKSDIASAMPFSIPVIGEPRYPSAGVNEFVVPELDSIQCDVVVSRLINDPVTHDILQDARDEAARIIAEAEAHRELIEQSAAERAAAETTETVEVEIAERVADLRVRLAETITKVSSMADKLSTDVESDLVDLAIRIAKKIVAREVTIDREIALTLVKVSLAKLHNRSTAEVHLNSEDFAFVKAHIDKLDFRGSLDIVEDNSISVGGCLIHTETGDIDARIESQFDEISHGLLD